jgi:multimeric flavodoxin WrbA
MIASIPRGAIMKAVVLLATLKRTGRSNTATLCEFLTARMARAGISCETIKLVDHAILPGTYSDMGRGDAWPGILRKVLAADILIFATPIWWSNQSSLMQRVIERLDELHDYVMAGKPSGLEGKTGGIVVTGDSDGSQHIIGNLCNFFNGIGLLIPPYATLTVQLDQHAKSKHPTRAQLMRRYESDYAKVAEKMIQQLVAFANP